MKEKSISLKADTTELEKQLDRLMEKANQLKATLLEMKQLFDSLGGLK